MIRAARLLAITLAVGCAAGETLRSWGAHRPLFAVVDDYLMAAFLLIAARRAARPEGPALLAAAFGFASGILYGSFFLHVAVWTQPDPGNIPQKPLTVLIGVAFAGSLLGLALSLAACLRRPR